MIDLNINIGLEYLKYKYWISERGNPTTIYSRRTLRIAELHIVGASRSVPLAFVSDDLCERGDGVDGVERVENGMEEIGFSFGGRP